MTNQAKSPIIHSKEGYFFTITPTHKNAIVAGDTILLDGELKTVSRSNIRHDPFMGKTLFGDSFKLGLQLVQRVTFVQKPTI